MKSIFRIIVLILILSACHHADHDSSGTDHDHGISGDETERESRSVTLYSENLEIFAEYQKLEEDTPSDFLIHITLIKEGHKPYEGNQVGVTLDIEGRITEGTASPAAVPGIYELSLAPPAAGIGKMTFHVGLDGNEEILPEEGVKVYKDGDEVGMHTESAVGGLIKFTKEQAWNSNFNVIRVEEGSFAEVINVSGELLAMPGEKQHVVARSEGIVLFGPENLVQGSFVSKGDEMFTLSDRGLVDNNVTVQYNKAKINFNKSKSDYERHKLLVKDNIISQGQFLETEERYLYDSVVYYSFKESMGFTGMKVYAPMSGYLHDLNVAEGQFVEPGDLIATISTNKVMLLRADVPQQQFEILPRITTAQFRPAYSSRIYSMEELAGRLLAKGASVAENNHFIPVYFEVRNDGSLLEGAFAEFYLKAQPEPGHLVIPVSSLLEEQGNYYVYVQVSGEEYQKRPVNIAHMDGTHAAIASGLQVNERIVSEGVMLIKTATSSALPAHSHSH